MASSTSEDEFTGVFDGFFELSPEQRVRLAEMSEELPRPDSPAVEDEGDTDAIVEVGSAESSPGFSPEFCELSPCERVRLGEISAALPSPDSPVVEDEGDTDAIAAVGSAASSPGFSPEFFELPPVQRVRGGSHSQQKC